MSTAKHTDGPWQTHGSHIYGAQRELIAQFCGENTVGDRDLAIRAVNAHDDLLEALKEAEKAEAALISEWADFWDVAPQALVDSLMKAQSLRNAAIAKAEGGEL